VPVDGIAVAVAQGTSVINNRIEGGANTGIRTGIQKLQTPRRFAGSCTLDPARACLENDRSPAGCPVGVDTCKGVNTQFVSWVSRNTLIEGNVILGPFSNAINTGGEGTRIINNTIDGRNRTTAGPAIQLFGQHALMTATVRHNSVSNVDVALGLVQRVRGQNADATEFKAEIRLNDFTQYLTAVAVTQINRPPFDPNIRYNLPSELSKGGQGNFWGTRFCLGLTSVKNTEDGTPNKLVTDHSPYGISVAQLLNPPSPCPAVSH
jgi:hypothetical protein